MDKHHIMYDYITLENELNKLKFKSVRRARFNDSEYAKYFNGVEGEANAESRWSYPMNIGFECIK